MANPLDWVLDPRFVGGVIVGWWLCETRPRQCPHCGHQNLQGLGPSHERLTTSQRRSALANEFMGGAFELATQRAASHVNRRAENAFDAIFDDGSDGGDAAMGGYW